MIRHAEKPHNGDHLSATGQARAEAYIDYFKQFKVEGKALKLESLFAAAKSKHSNRSVLTLEPLSKSLNIPINDHFEDSQLANDILQKPHGQQMLICWHHSDMPKLFKALGATDLNHVIPMSGWPDDVFNWVIELRYDANGTLSKVTKTVEPFESSANVTFHKLTETHSAVV